MVITPQKLREEIELWEIATLHISPHPTDTSTYVVYLNGNTTHLVRQPHFVT